MVESIGAKIKQLRESLKVDLQELAAAAKIDIQKLKHIEEGNSNPSISTLIKLARRLGVRPGTMLDGTENSNPVITTKKDGGVALQQMNSLGAERGNMNFISLAQNKKDRNMEPYIVLISYTAKEESALSSHEGEEFLYVLEGEVVIYYGNQTYNLGEGDSIYYDSVVQHVVSSNAPGAVAKVLAVTYTPC